MITYDYDTILLQNTLCVPSLKMNLISVQAMSKDLNCIFLLNGPNFRVNDNETGIPLLKGKAHDGMYYVNNSINKCSHAMIASSISNDLTIEILHRRCGIHLH